MNNKKDTLRAEFIEYVSKLTRHIRIDYLRRLQHRREHETPKEDLYDNEQDEGPAIDDTLTVDEEVQLNWILSNLTCEEQRIVQLCVVEDRSALEVAAVLGKSERWIRTVKTRALFKLKNSVLEGEQGERRTRF